MKRYRSRRPRGPLMVAAFVLSALAFSVFVMLPLAVASQLPEFRASVATVAGR